MSSFIFLPFYFLKSSPIFDELSLINRIKTDPLSMLVIGQKSCFLGSTIFEIPQPNWYYVPKYTKISIQKYMGDLFLYFLTYPLYVLFALISKKAITKMTLGVQPKFLFWDHTTYTSIIWFWKTSSDSHFASDQKEILTC